MRTIAISEAGTRLSSLVQEIDKDTFAIERDGRKVAYLISPEEYATTRKARGQALLEAYGALSVEIADKASRGEVDVDDLMRSLYRKAS
jgi:PHD/YefM family antitoxin component YafN of YafNO toxin-antitoxin module